MRALIPLCVLLLSLSLPAQTQTRTLKRATVRLTAEVTQHATAFANLEELTRTIGPRLSGSPGAAKAVAWARTKLQGLGLDRVWLEPTRVPHWERGTTETARARSEKTGADVKLAVTALGGSVGTDGTEAEVVEVKGLDEVDGRVKGKIVFYNRPMAGDADPFKAYGNAVDQRVGGPAVAAKFGAVATLVRSLSTLPDDDNPHTGNLHYESGVPRIPAAALSTHAANTLAKVLHADPSAKVRLVLSARDLPPVVSYNVIGEIKGREIPDESVVVGAHLDSWDLATGAHDDGAGVVETLEVLRALKTTGLRPRRTVRGVLFMAEEPGGIGARDFARARKKGDDVPIAALESDEGGFAPRGFRVDASDEVLARVRSWRPYLEPVHAAEITKDETGTDVEPLGELGAATFGFRPDGRHYFDLHHSALDRIEAVTRQDLHASAAAITVLTYLLAEQGLPEADLRASNESGQ